MSVVTVLVGKHPSVLVVGNVVEVSMFDVVLLQWPVSADEDEDRTSWLVELIVGVVVELEDITILRVEVIHAGAERVSNGVWVR